MIERRIAILYASQTGTAQDIAEDIWRQSKKIHFKGSVKAMNSYDLKDLINENIVIFVCSTTGQGEEPDNMKSFWKFLLRKSLPSDSLAGVKYAVLGLGDSSYTKFNFVAKRLNKRLLQLGGAPLVPIGLCDDQHDLGLHAVAVPWIQNLWDKIDVVLPLPEGLEKLTTSPRVFRWNVQVADNEIVNNIDMSELSKEIGFIDSEFDKPFETCVVENVRTTAPDHFQDVRLISFEGNLSQWNPGDIFVCRPKNSPDRVRKLFEIFAEYNLQLFPETIIFIEEIDGEMPLPAYFTKPMSLLTIATEYWDLSAIPRPRVFEMLAHNCRNDLEVEKLIEFTKPEFQDDLFAYANRPRRTILEVFGDFPHATASATIQTLFEIFQPIKPRSFSIASCEEMDRLQLLVAIVEYKTIMSTPRLGLCSNWLKDLKCGDKIWGWIRRGTFKVPIDEKTPLIMVGPGTGLAPFRSILLQREFRKQFDPTHILFFGCRGEKDDFHCSQDLKRMESMELIKLFCAFSRDQEDKIYVQDKIKEQHNFIFEELTKENATILVAGNSKDMPQAVKATFCSIINSEYIERMIKNNRYQEETWG